MNKYITALLVVLAATGVEAQSYQSALKIALGDVNIEDLCHKQAFKGVEQSKAAFVTDLFDNYSIALTSQSNNNQESQLFLPNPSLRTGIKIRAPSLLPLV